MIFRESLMDPVFDSGTVEYDDCDGRIVSAKSVDKSTADLVPTPSFLLQVPQWQYLWLTGGRDHTNISYGVESPAALCEMKL